MAEAFGGVFTALYVQTPDDAKRSAADKERLETHMKLAEDAGADIVITYGNDVPYQIAEYARLSGVTKIVLGRSSMKRQHFWSKPTITERVTEIVPGMDIHIIPDAALDTEYRPPRFISPDKFVPQPRDLLFTVLLLAAATFLGSIFLKSGFTESSIITVYLLSVLLISVFTRGYTCSTLSAVLGVVLFNFFLTEPRLTLHAYGSGYPVTFATMLAASVITGTLASRLKDQAKLSALAAYRTQILFDANQLLQKARSEQEIMEITAGQLLKLLKRDIITYEVHGQEAGKEGHLSEGTVLLASPDADLQALSALLLNEEERAAAEWVFRNKKRAGASTGTNNSALCQYLAVRFRGRVYGVIGIHIGDHPLDGFENSVLLSILGECALAMENSRNAQEKEQAAVRAKNEALRANLLRAISHDLRTPLTSISGNADTLRSGWDKLDDETRERIFNDIYDDSQWLISLVENLLAVSRIEEGRMQLHLSPELPEEVIREALQHIRIPLTGHRISVDCGEELLLARMDARLISQVIINLVENALKYTLAGSSIVVGAEGKGDRVLFRVADDGPGIPDDLKARVFDMFFTGDRKVADSRRSLGLGLSLCRSIINAHGGEITLTDNTPSGCVFSFSLPADHGRTE
ncbi:MAG: sensor histidine kinase KdpD [Stomatobaculum sp.]|nr:sensor histidine kinase KdpD [Stomatobaculum sp.]